MHFAIFNGLKLYSHNVWAAQNDEIQQNINKSLLYLHPQNE